VRGPAPSPGRIRGVTFDLDDTLYDNRPVLARAERLVEEWLERHYPRLAARYPGEALRALRRQLAGERPELRHDITALRKTALAIAAEEVGYPPGLSEEAFRVFWTARNQVELFADVLPVLTPLRARYRIGAITNGNADVVRIGLAGVFEFALSAADLMASKPDPPLFLEAVRRVGGEPWDTVHVGDDATADIQGARAAGLRTVWVNRTGHPWEGEGRPDAEITSLWELPAVLARLEGG
jgi:putative hydrolase of the HAD superfamily